MEDNEQVVSAITGDWPTLTIGDQATITLRFRDDGALTVASGETHTVHADTAEFYESVTVEDSGTLTVEDSAELVIGSQEAVWRVVEDYTDYAGYAATGSGLDNQPWFIERLPADATVAGIVMGFEPSPRLQTLGVDGFWGLLAAARSDVSSPLTDYRLELTLVVLEEFDQYASVAAVKTDLEA